MNNNADRKFAVITGGSSGIGYEFAKVCAEENFGVLLIADQGVDDAAEGLMSSGAVVSTLEADCQPMRAMRASLLRCSVTADRWTCWL